MPHYDDDQDSDAARAGYHNMRARVKANVTPEEMTLRSAVQSLTDQLAALVFEMEIGNPVDPDQFILKAVQAGGLISQIEEMRVARIVDPCNWCGCAKADHGSISGCRNSNCKCYEFHEKPVAALAA